MTVTVSPNNLNTPITEPVELGALEHGDLFLTDEEPSTDGADHRLMFLSFNSYGNAMVSGNYTGNNFVRGFESGFGRDNIVYKVIGYAKR